MRTLLIILALVLACPMNASAEKELLDRVIAVVNDEPITQSELDMLLRPIVAQYREEYQGQERVIKMNEARQKLLNQLIEDRLVYQEAVSQGIEPDPVEIEKNIEEFKKRFPDEMTLEEMLKSQGMTLNDVRERFRKQEMIRELHSREIRAKIVVSPREIEEYYNEHSGEFAEQERLKVRSITIKKNYEAREKGIQDEAARRQIQELAEKIRAGDDFSRLAREFSQDVHAANGGLSDWISRGSMIPVIDDVIFSLGMGEVSDIIETPMGYHLFRLEEKQQGHKRTLDEVRNEILSALYQKKSEERFYDWMQELKRDAYIAIR